MAGKKKLLIFAHYYAPDIASTGQILQELAEGLLDTFDVTVICTVPSYLGTVDDKYKKHRYYKEEINGVKLLRIRVPEFDKTNTTSRIKNILGYFFGAMGAVFQVGTQDYVFSISQPPILGGLVGVWGKWTKRAKFIYNIQDFNPEQTIAVGYSRNKLILRIMLWLDKFSCKRSNLVVTVGRDLGETLVTRFKGRKVPKYTIINNWADDKKLYPLDSEDEKVINFKKKYGLESKFVFLYSGNIGIYYDLEGLLKVIEKIGNITTPDGREVVFAFIGEGAVLNNLIHYTEEHDMKNTIFIPYQAEENVVYSLNAGDVHWCISAKGIKGVSCPSKFYGIAAVGKPVLGILETGSEIRCLIEDSGCGRVVNPQDYEAIQKEINWFVEHADAGAGAGELKFMGDRGRLYLEKNLTKDVSIEKYKENILNI